MNRENGFSPHGILAFLYSETPGTRAERQPLHGLGHVLTASVHQRLADALSAALPEAGSADPLLRRSDRADFQANGILALAKKAKANPRELATQVVARVESGDVIKDIEVSGPAS